MLNPGKQFEADFKDSCKDQDIWLMRINDTYVTARNVDPDAYIPQQPCDYVLHYGPCVYLCELKSTDKKYITVERSGSHGMIKEHQYKSMERLTGDYERAALVLQFQRGTDEQATYWMPIQGFLSYLESTDKKSINRLDVVQFGGVPIDQHKLIKHYRYDVLSILNLSILNLSILKRR